MVRNKKNILIMPDTYRYFAVAGLRGLYSLATLSLLTRIFAARWEL